MHALGLNCTYSILISKEYHGERRKEKGIVDYPLGTGEDEVFKRYYMKTIHIDKIMLVDDEGLIIVY